MAIRDGGVAANRRMGAHGAKLLKSGSVITHCNAGALATAGDGTALGGIRAAIAAGDELPWVVGGRRRRARPAPQLPAWPFPAWKITAAMESVMRVQGMPSLTSSHAVSLAPWRNGRVSPTNT